MKKLLAVILLGSLLIATTGCHRFQNRNNTQWNESTIAQDIINEHNDIRKNNKLLALHEDERLNAAAQKHASYMAAQDKISHYGEWFSRPSDRIEDEGYNYWGVAENVAAGQRSVEEVMRDWMNSSGHRHNILGNYTEIGVGVARNAEGRIYWCVVFARPQQ